MSVTRIATRYAKSLLDLAKERGELDTVLSDIESFNAACASRDLVLFLKSPIINPGKKKQVFNALFEGKYSKTTSAFFDIIINKGREKYLKDIGSEFISLYKKDQKISTVTITTAAPLSDSELAQIKAKLTSNEDIQANMDIITKVDPNLIGGFIVTFDDKRYDASIASKLNDLKKEFEGNLYISQISK